MAPKTQNVFQRSRSYLTNFKTIYRTGISGIGAVTAMEILATFKSTPEQNDVTTQTMSVLSGLRKFRSWWEHSRNVDKKSGLRNKLHNIELSAEFPSAHVSCQVVYVCGQ